MRLTILGALLSLAVLPVAAQTADPISGKWGSDGATFLDLKYDGKTGITGTAIWRGDGKEVAMPIKSGTFDPKKGAFTIEGDGEGPDGRKGAYRIEGVVTGDVIRGKYTFAGRDGDFSFDRLNGAEKEFDYLLGDWEFTSEDKEYGKLRGYWSAVKLAEGQILDEYRVVGDDGETYYVTSTLRNYNKFLARWELIGSEPGSGLQDFGTAKRVGGEMHIEQTFGVAGGKPSMMRIRYFNIRPDAFSWAGDRSTDGGKTWVKNHLTIEARRIGPARTLPSLAPARNKKSQR
jgi:hypothetical protein